MSITGSVAEGLGAYNGVMSALSGPPVKIGAVGLTSLEVPATMPFGGEQRLSVHDLVGAGRVVDAMGPTEADITWSGMFSGPGAVSRARAIDAMRQAGQQVTLTWADFARQVVIRSFKAEYGRGGALLPYSITCVVIPTPATAPAQTLLGSIAGDISNALDLPDLTAAASKAITVAQAALPVAAVLTGGSKAFIGLSSALGTASTAVGAAQSLADGQLGAVGSAASAAGEVFGGASGLLAAVNAQGLLASATQAVGYVGRAVKNLAGG